LGVTGAATFNNGFTFSGGTGGVGTLSASANWGGLLMGRSGAVADVALQASDGAVPLRILPGSNVQVGFVTSINNTQTLSGSAAPTRVGNFANNLAGTTTVAGDSALFQIGAASDTAALTNNATIDYLYVTANLGAGYNGSRVGVFSAINTNGATTLTNGGLSTSSFHGRLASVANLGGNPTGFGTTSFGLGSQFGAVLENLLQPGATAYSGQIGLELDMACFAGASVSERTAFKIVTYAQGVTQGSNIDQAIQFGNATGAAGWRNLIAVGEYSYGWPLDANGYVMQARTASNGGSPVIGTGAGFIDANQFNPSGTGPEGGGFFWRSKGMQILDTAAQIGYLSVSAGASGPVLDSTYKQMATAAGSITVAAGGTNFTTGDIATDAFGNTVVVVASAGVVTGISSVITRGWSASPPADPVTFTARSRQANLGTGLTLNLGSWTGQTTLSLQPSGGATTVGGAITVGGTVTLNGSGTALSVTNDVHVGTFTSNGPGYFSAGFYFDKTGTPANDGRAGSIHADANWGCIIHGMAGGIADVALQANDGTAPLRIGGSNKIGFTGTNPIAKPTVSGAKGSNAALASLLTALAAYGLVTDTTTA
jgi:hypothetical protein